VYVPCNNQDAKWGFSDKREYRKILDSADYVTEFKKVKHPYDRGIIGRIGIEF
jgi:ATP:corrinoid adenosyltransferase